MESEQNSRAAHKKRISSESQVHSAFWVQFAVINARKWLADGWPCSWKNVIKMAWKRPILVQLLSLHKRPIGTNKQKNKLFFFSFWHINENTNILDFCWNRSDDTLHWNETENVIRLGDNNNHTMIIWIIIVFRLLNILLPIRMIDEMEHMLSRSLHTNMHLISLPLLKRLIPSGYLLITIIYSLVWFSCFSYHIDLIIFTLFMWAIDTFVLKALFYSYSYYIGCRCDRDRSNTYPN